MPAGIAIGLGAAGSAVEGALAANSNKDTASANNAETGVVNAGYNTALSGAEKVANQPFEAYTGEFGAPLSYNQGQALSLASNSASQNQAGGLMNQAVGEINQVAGSTWNPQTEAQYMNPYTQAVTNNAIESANQSYEQQLGQMKEQQAQSGSFGGSGTATEQAELGAQENLNVGNLTANNYANAYNTAYNQWQQNNQLGLQAASAYENAGNDITNMTGAQIQQLMQTGGAAQAVQQTDLNGQYQEFLRGQNWSANQLQPLLTATKGGPDSYQNVPQSGVASSILGLGSTIAGLYGGGYFSGLTGGGGGSSTSQSYDALTGSDYF